ncbi:acyl-CoA synthetase [Maribacter hydrothermalis]|uniref:Long-chain fatty acid--CoA ligase n=1 Tax=Maribacter hydrothermalis TaxID=1836467 RepID=A0A1B7YXW7_9FLAO|nr:acyl-CoA synthetase [Maribacter hydrothermalis]APQ16797.1 long-chain fatty acid--CoA ligase [Maribacter hydrothermalis]OBR35226.1 long-chain fatty acid--CoA ligase [Maribacter hydrothermalis]
MITLIKKASSFKNRIAIKSNGQNYTYNQLLQQSEHVSACLLQGKEDLDQARIAFLVPASFSYVTVQWGIWRAGGIAVPLCEKHPLPSIKYVLDDTKATTVIYTEAFEKLLSPLFKSTHIQFIKYTDIKPKKCMLPTIILDRSALILYTSGTTGSPKGVVTTHANIEAQITALTTSWEWSKNDHVLNVLPLHHVHGIINMLSCALWSGACCEFLSKFDPKAIFDIFLKDEVNVFMAVPTIYFKLIYYFNELSNSEKAKISEHLSKFRLMVSGSAALPVSVLEEWKEISGHILLERYGMTEMGMAISNPYNGIRRPGHIGQPLHGVSIRLADENNKVVPDGTPGEIQIKGPNVFKEYWDKPEATSNSFTPDGWFQSGDIAIFDVDSYQILGRNSVDIIKSGGYKISALEIEEVLRTHPMIKDCGVVGIPDLEWGEIIGASIVLKSGELLVENLTSWITKKLPAYKTPRKYIFQEDLPRNVMGKVTKNEIKKLFT